MKQKIYKFPELKKIAVEQSYKCAALEDSQGTRIFPYNNYKTKLDKQFQLIQGRLNSDIIPEGIYYVTMAININRTRQPDRYPIVKGDAIPEAIIQAPLLNENKKAEPSVLSYASALQMQKRISDLENEKIRLEALNENLRAQIAELEKELEAPLEEKESSVKTFINEGLPSVMPILDKWFMLEEKKLAVKEKELENKPANAKKRVIRRELPAGSKEHLLLIETLYRANNEEKLNNELDRLEAENKELYLKVCNELGFELNEGEPEESEATNE